MDEIERRRLQALVDAVHLTCAAVGARSGAAGATNFGRMRAGGSPPGTTWWPMPAPRGWLPIWLGTESEMYVPYLSPFMSHVMPVYPGVGSPGLIHSGIGPVGSGIPMGIGPIPYGSYGSYGPGIYGQGIYGYRPQGMFPYGMGLVHSGWEGSTPGGINPLFGMNPMMPSMMSGPMMPGSPMPMSSIPNGSMGMGSMPGMPMQPAWSPMPPSNMPTM